MVGDIPFERFDASAVRKCRRSRIITAVICGDIQTGSLQCDADCLADAARSTGDDRDPCHTNLPRISVWIETMGCRPDLQAAIEVRLKSYRINSSHSAANSELWMVDLNSLEFRYVKYRFLPLSL